MCSFPFLLTGKECPKLDSEQQNRANHILAFSPLFENKAQMYFSNIVIDSALREHLCCHIPTNKVLWDHQGIPRNQLFLSTNWFLSHLLSPRVKRLKHTKYFLPWTSYLDVQVRPLSPLHAPEFKNQPSNPRSSRPTPCSKKKGKQGQSSIGATFEEKADK